MKWRLFNILIALLLASCTTGGHRAPIQERKQPPSQRIQTHTVSAGETLFSIAWRYGIDYRTLATRNGISGAYTIYPGQKLSLWRAKSPKSSPKSSSRSPKLASRPSSRPPAKGPSKPKVKPRPRPKTKSAPTQPTRSKTKTPPKSSSKSDKKSIQGVVWQWPTKGRLLSRFNASGGLNKGIDLGGKLGEPVVSAAAGRVVYAGNGLRGYGLLLIVKHSENYLSAYAHNNKLRVKEGDIVKGGQRIADIGSSGANRIKLHFEIRKDGKSVNPLGYLPKR